MIMYQVIKYFEDLQDGNHKYKVGDKYPRDGFEVLHSRIKELSTSANRQGVPLIEEIKEEANEKKTTHKVKKNNE